MKKLFTSSGLIRSLMMLLLLVAGTGQMLWAQSVTVSPTTGKLIASKSDDPNETGFQNGLCALWRHEQLPLSLTTSDDTGLTDGGEFITPTSNMCVNLTTGLLTILGGQSADSHFILSLPKGYRFKGYEIVVVNNLNNQSVRPTANNSFALSSTTKTLVECKDGFSEEIKSTASMGTTNSNTEYVLKREGLEGEWSNQLYFKITHSSNVYYGLTIKSFKVLFTAEGTFEAAVESESKDVAKSLVMAPFKTNKMDIGAVQSLTKNNATFYAYTYSNVRDLDANTYIYQDDAVQDGVPMDVAETKKIYPVTVDGKDYFAFCNGTYYVEAPTQVYSQTGLSYPIGFRIVGTKFTPQWGTQTPGGTETRNYFYITYTSDNTTYYLNDQLRFTTTRFGWYYDESTQSIFTGYGNNVRYLACEGSGNTRTLTFSYENGGYYNLIPFTRNNRTYVGWTGNSSYNRWYLQGSTVASTLPTVMRYDTNATNAAAWVGAGQQTVTFPAFKPGSYTLNIYDKTGATVAATKTVNSAADAGEAIDLSAKSYGYNNDAIKFQITGLASGCQALVDVSVFMQALNPYIDKMDIVCHDADNQLSLSQNFEAEDFKVSGGVFNFYIPSAYANKDLTFSFETLWSQYGDNTYYTGDLQKDGFARYSFVTSSYFEPIDLNGDNGLYDAAYSPNTSYVNKVKTTKAGNIRYKFNNAENLSNTATNPPAVSYLEEYPFSVAAYVGSADPDGGTETGAFNPCVLNATTNHSDVYYLFVADETRYNIAPSTAWQHRYYAFYRMDINLATQTYDPKLTWTKVYDNTCYVKNGAETAESMWGLKLQTVLHNSNTIIEGYMSVKDIDDAIKADLGKTNCPTSADQILYVDGSELYSIINSTVTTTPTDGSDPVTTTMTLETLKNKIATNALFYLPSRTTSTLSNFASKSGTGFKAGKDIVITDKEPFFAPYDISVDVDNKAYYERLVTLDKYGKVQNASLIMPFKVEVNSSGVHTNVDGSTFSLHTMQSGNSLAVKDDKLTAYFPELDGVTITEANKPYMVKLEDNPAENGKNYSFVVSQKGAPIVATLGMASDYTYTSTASTGEVTTGEAEGLYTFTPTGTYAGKYVPKSDNIFYFAKDLFWSSLDLNRPNVSIYPFRAYYKTQSTSRVSPTSLQVFFGTNEDEMEDAIRDLKEKNMDMSLRAGKGTITVAAAEDCNVRINGINGISRHNLDMNAGETRTISVPAGVYVVNGVKILVK